MEILKPYVEQGAIKRPRKHDIRAIINARRLLVENVAKRFSAVSNSV